MKWYLTDKIIDKYENSKSDWNQVLAGNRSLKIQEEDYRACGKQELLKEAAYLEERGLITQKWIIRGSDLERIKYSLSDMPAFYRMSGRTPKYELIKSYISELENMRRHIRKEWLRDYLNSLLNLLNQGKIPFVHEKKEKYRACILGLDQLGEPIYKRVFSKRYLGGSKVFEQELESHIIAIAKRFHPAVDENMDDPQILSQIFIEEYSQELLLKGPLSIDIDGRELDLGVFRYGTVLNSETLKHAKILPKQKIKKIVTIENKANFMVQPFEEETLYLYTHGYFSPKEKEFLTGLTNVLHARPVGYYHTGDLDYGGICIYRYIKQHIFPELKPYRMDVKTYMRYLEYGEPVKEETLSKLGNLEGAVPQEMASLLEELLDKKMAVEQEIFLTGLEL